MAVRGLGRGLDALLGGSMPEQEEINPAEIQAIALDSIVPNPNQPRREFDQAALEELSASIKAQGVLQPVLVRPLDSGYELVAGERRMRAARMAGLSDIPALVREMDDQQSLAIALIENLQREDLNPLEEAQGYRRLLDEFDLSQEELANTLGKSRSTLANALRLLNLPQSIQQDLQQGRITPGHARALLSLEDDSSKQDLHERIVSGQMTVRQAESEASYFKEHGALPESAPAPAPAVSGAREGGRAPRSRSLDQNLLALQDKLSEDFSAKVAVNGHVNKGKIVFHYDSEEELRELAARLGADAVL